MSKRRSLASAIKGVEAPAEVEVKQPPAPQTAESRPKPVGVLTYISQPDHERLRELSFHSKTSLQKLGLEAWSLLLEKRGLDPLEIVTSSAPGGRRKA